MENTKNILIMLTQYKAKKANMDKEKQELENLKNDILSYMNGERKIIVGQYTVTNTECTKKTLDEKAIREQFPELAEQFERVTTYDRFVVK